MTKALLFGCWRMCPSTAGRVRLSRHFTFLLAFSAWATADSVLVDAIFRVERGRMRNLWYPTKKAEYMTADRFAELGLSRRDDVGERDPMFRAYETTEDVAEEDVVEEGSDMPVFSLAVCSVCSLALHCPVTSANSPGPARAHSHSPNDSCS